MTDPVTNVEIEDVLSSIRRLVSENGRGATKRAGAEPAAETPAEPELPKDRAEAKAPPAEDEMLVLTPALRVEEEAAGGGFAAALQSAVRDALDEAVDEALGQPSKDEEHAPETLADEPALLAEDAGESLKERIAELETAVAEQDDEWEPDGDSEDAYAATPIETLAWEDHIEDEAQETAAEPDREWLDEVEEAEFVEAEAEDEIGAAPEPIFVHAADPEPEPEDAPELAEEPAEGMDAADPVEEDVPEEALDLFGSDTSVIDEEMLREMVADIVRQELQGTLGERITRNVRKLVRREIHRALAAHELD